MAVISDDRPYPKPPMPGWTGSYDRRDDLDAVPVETWIAVQYSVHGVLDPQARLVTEPVSGTWSRYRTAFGSREEAQAICEADWAARRDRKEHDQRSPLIWHRDIGPEINGLIRVGGWTGCYPNHGDRDEQFPEYHVILLDYVET